MWAALSSQCEQFGHLRLCAWPYANAGDAAYTAVGGTATGSTTITNFAAITSKAGGIYGLASAAASGYGAYTGSTGSGTGGTAVAGVVITNNAGGTISSSNGEGIDGYAGAKAIAKGWFAFWRDGDSPPRRSPILPGSRAGITVSMAPLRHTPAPITAGGSGYYAVGGTAVAGVVITNNTGGTIIQRRTKRASTATEGSGCCWRCGLLRDWRCCECHAPRSPTSPLAIYE